MNGSEFFKGFARVPLSALHFDHKLGRKTHRSASTKNVQRLVKLFSKVGCQHGAIEHAISATLGSDSLQEALEDCDLETLPQDVSEGVDVLPLLQVTRLNCLHGLHRVLAAKEVLDGEDQWWIVKIYSNSMSPN